MYAPVLAALPPVMLLLASGVVVVMGSRPADSVRSASEENRSPS